MLMEVNHIKKTCPNYEAWGEENLRLAALDMTNQWSYLCDQAYFNDVIDAVKKGAQGRRRFVAICREAGLCDELIPLLWKMLKAATEGAAAGWIPLG
jgi:hypothetical protein